MRRSGILLETDDSVSGFYEAHGFVRGTGSTQGYWVWPGPPKRARAPDAGAAGSGDGDGKRR